MNTREEAIKYGLSFANTYVEAPFRDQNWQLVRVKGSKKAFLWVYEKDGFIHLNVKVEPERCIHQLFRGITRIKSIGIRLSLTERYRKKK